MKCAALSAAPGAAPQMQSIARMPSALARLWPVGRQVNMHTWLYTLSRPYPHGKVSKQVHLIPGAACQCSICPGDLPFRCFPAVMCSSAPRCGWWRRSASGPHQLPLALWPSIQTAIGSLTQSCVMRRKSRTLR